MPDTWVETEKAAARQQIGNLTHIPAEVSALFSALRLSEPDARPLSRLSDKQWNSLLEFSDLARLTLPLAQLPMGGLPFWVVQRLRINLDDNAERFERMKGSYQEISAVLIRSGIEFIVLKGFTQVPDYVSSPRLRVQSDFDIYCLPEHIEAARTALESIGYFSDTHYKNYRSADHIPILLRYGNAKWNGNNDDSEIPFGIDLHFCLWNTRVLRFPVPVDNFWRRRVTRNLEGMEFPALQPVDQLGYLSLHILRGLLRNDWTVNYVRELAVFLHAHMEDDLFWETWSKLHDSSLQKFEVVSFYLARSWFACKMHRYAEHAIASLPINQFNWLSHVSASALDNMFCANKDAVWLHLTYLRFVRDRIAVLRQTFFPLGISGIHAPCVLLRNRRRVQARGPLWIQYITYLFSRTLNYFRAGTTALWHGFYWRLTRARLSSQYWTFFVVFIFFNLGLSIYYFLINIFLMERGYTEKSLGIFTAAIAAGNLSGALPWGRLAQRIGLTASLFLCFALVILACSARALMLSFSWQVILSFLAGVAFSAWVVCLFPAVACLSEEKQRPRAFSLLFSVGIGTGVLGGLIGGRATHWLRNQHLALAPVQFVLLVSCSIVALGFWPLRKLHLGSYSIVRRPRLQLSSFLLRYLAAVAVWSFVTGSFSPLATVYLMHRAHLSLTQTGSAFSLAQVIQILAVLLAPALFRRWGLISGIVATQVGAAMLLVALAFATTPFASASAYICFSAFQYMNEPCIYSLLMNKVPAEHHSGASASNNLVMSGSQVIAAALAGEAFAHYGYPATFSVIAMVALLSSCLFWTLHGFTKQDTSAVLQNTPG
ncbi:MAG: MFS transporter [Acidobacteriaceae bacterium]|nr:MFS transporter [Acidobacteriaceae bacterium]